ncbi:hypothetical protein TEA_023358 [Camellia sinensis var. sinensis]|uniref:Uncharacterized protein n=1 Tax=Camellia sinensis var. sinensis TaxID=542762 RepID=A0A4V3WN41_CAMSN|nr:hypothetical protein TEA_023358 [Camellia sinensis var. sinensis]
MITVMMSSGGGGERWQTATPIYFSITVWRSRGCLPVVIEVTASIVEIQQKDPFFRVDLGDDAFDSEEMLTMLYCMAIVRYTAFSSFSSSHSSSLFFAAVAATPGRDHIGKEHDEVHEVSDDDAIDQNMDARRDFDHDFEDATIGEDIEDLDGTGGGDGDDDVAMINADCGNNDDNFGDNDGLLLVNGVVEKTRKKTEVSIAKAADAINIPRMLIDIRHEGSHPDLPSLRLVRLASIKALDWLKSYFWEPQKKAIPYQSDGIGSLRKEIKYRLCELAFWLKIKHTKGSSSSLAKGKRTFFTRYKFAKATLVKLLRKSLLVSSPSNNQLWDAALVLAHMIGNCSLVQKLNKLCFLGASNPTFDEENSPATSSESNLARLEDSIHQAAKKLEFVKLHGVKSNVLKTTDGDVGNNNRWVITKSWNSCPIGMLPCDVGSSGRLPVLDCDDDDKEDLKPLESKEQRALSEGMLKRGLDCDVELFNNLLVKKMRGSEGVCESDGKDDTLSEGVKGRLMIGGVWKNVEEEELFAIASAEHDNKGDDGDKRLGEEEGKMARE